MARKTTPAARPAASKSAAAAQEPSATETLSPVTVSEVPEVKPITMSDPDVPNDPPRAVLDPETGAPVIDGSPERGIAMEFQQVQPDEPQVQNDDADATPRGIDVQEIEAKPEQRSNAGVGGGFGGRTTGPTQAAVDTAVAEDPAPEPGRAPTDDPEVTKPGGGGPVVPGRLVYFRAASSWDGARVAPAIITRVFDLDADDRQVVGLYVMPPGAPAFTLRHGTEAAGEGEDETNVWFFPARA